MTYPITQQGETTVIELPLRSLDASNAGDFKQSLGDSLRGGTQYLLDLARTEFVDSSGLGALIAMLRQVHSSGGELKLSNLTPPVLALFELVRMHKVFEIYNSVDEGLRSYQ